MRSPVAAKIEHRRHAQLLAKHPSDRLEVGLPSVIRRNEFDHGVTSTHGPSWMRRLFETCG